MSETQVIGKPLSPSIRVSSTDSHKITTPVPRPVRGGAQVTGAKRSVTGEPLRPTTPDVVIGKQPSIETTTASSTSRTTKIQGAPAKTERSAARTAGTPSARTVNPGQPVSYFNTTEAGFLTVLVRQFLGNHDMSDALEVVRELTPEGARSIASAVLPTLEALAKGRTVK